VGWGGRTRERKSLTSLRDEGRGRGDRKSGRGWWVTEIGGSLTHHSLHPTTPSHPSLLSLVERERASSLGGEEKR